MPHPLGATKQRRYDVNLDTHKRNNWGTIRWLENQDVQEESAVRGQKSPLQFTPTGQGQLFVGLNLRGFAKSLQNDQNEWEQVIFFSPINWQGVCSGRISNWKSLFVGSYFLHRFLSFLSSGHEPCMLGAWSPERVSFFLQSWHRVKLSCVFLRNEGVSAHKPYKMIGRTVRTKRTTSSVSFPSIP